LSADRAQLQAILTKASVLEAARQRAARAKDVAAEAAAQLELARLREAYRAAEAAQQNQIRT
jgi:hypothetical protein